LVSPFIEVYVENAGLNLDHVPIAFLHSAVFSEAKIAKRINKF